MQRMSLLPVPRALRISRSCGLLASVLLPFFSFSLVSLVPLAHAAEPIVGLRSLALGDGMRGYATGAEGPLLNPSGMVLTRQFAVAGFYSLRVQSLGHFLHSSVVDSVTQRYVAIGAYYNYLHENPRFAIRLPEGGSSQRVVLVQTPGITREANEAGLAAAVPVGDRFSFGATLKYGNYSTRAQLIPEDVPADFTYQNPAIDKEHNYDLGSVGNVFSFDVGITLRLFDELRVGLVGHNLWAHGPEVPTQLGLGLSYRFSERLLIAGDAVFDFTGHTTCGDGGGPLCAEVNNLTTTRLSLGAEYVVVGRLPLRLGYAYDDFMSSHSLSGGLGYLPQGAGYGIDFSFRQRLAGGDETVLLLGFRVLRE